MTIAEFTQLWFATFSLDPSICREALHYLRALGDVLSDQPSGDDEVAIPVAAFVYLLILGEELRARGSIRGAFMRPRIVPEAVAAPVLSRPR